MGNEAESFWTDIKRYEDMLAKDPASYCFAPLAELYRKVGLLDDAINAARKGIEIHPEYVGGFMALGRACFEKGEKAESRTALEKVVRVTPDNLLAQKLLSQIYIDAGEIDLAARSLETILALNPDDLESKVAYEALQRSTERFAAAGDDFFAAGEASAESGEWSTDDESLLEEVEIIEELGEALEDEALTAGEGVELDVAAAPPVVADELREEAGPGAEEGIPFVTSTVAELYVAQGFLPKARTIYAEMLSADPENEGLKARIAELDRLLAAEGAAPSAEDSRGVPAPPAGSAASVGKGAAPDVVVVLEGWLDTIGRMRQCRSERR